MSTANQVDEDGRRPSPAVEVVELTDPTAAGEGLEVLRQDVVQLESRRLQARRIVVRLEEIVVVFHSTNLRVRARTTLADGIVAFTVFGARAGGTMNALPVGPDLMMATEPGFPVELVVEAGYESVALLVPLAVLQAHSAGRRAEPLRAPLGVEAIRVAPCQARDLFDWAKRLVETAARRPALFDHRRVTLAAARAELLERLLAALASGTSRERTRSDGTLRDHGRVVRVAEAHAVEHRGDHLYVKDLCVAAGVSERTLEGAFRRVLGLTPVAFLMRLRLHGVRKALRSASPGSTTVSAAALDWGFWHFGDFSRAYRECFGELPSETLRRRGRDRQRPPPRPRGAASAR